MLTSLVFLSLWSAVTESHEPISEEALNDAILIEEDGRMLVGLDFEGQQLCISTEPACTGATMQPTSGYLWFYVYDLTPGEYVRIPTSDLYDAITGDGELTFVGLEGEAVLVADIFDGSGVNLVAEQH